MFSSMFPNILHSPHNVCYSYFRISQTDLNVKSFISLENKGISNKINKLKEGLVWQKERSNRRNQNNKGG